VKLKDSEANQADDYGTQNGFFREDFDDKAWNGSLYRGIGIRMTAFGRRVVRRTFDVPRRPRANADSGVLAGPFRSDGVDQRAQVGKHNCISTIKGGVVLRGVFVRCQ